MDNQKMNFMNNATGDTLEALGRTASTTGADEKRFRAWHTVEAVHDFLQGRVEENLPSGRRPQMKPHDIHILPEVLLDNDNLELAMESLYKAFGLLQQIRDRKRMRATLVLVQRVTEELCKIASGIVQEGNDLSFSGDFDQAEERFERAVAMYKYILGTFRRRYAYCLEKQMLKDEQIEMDGIIGKCKETMEGIALTNRRRDLKKMVEAVDKLESDERFEDAEVAWGHLINFLDIAERRDLREVYEDRLSRAVVLKLKQMRVHACKVFQRAEDAEDDDTQMGARDAWNLYREAARIFELTGDSKAAKKAMSLHHGVASLVEKHIRRDAMVAEAKSDHDACMTQIELLEEWLVLHGRESETEELRPWRIEVMTSMSRHRVEAAYRTLERGMPQFQEGYDDTLRTLEDAQGLCALALEYAGVATFLSESIGQGMDSDGFASIGGVAAAAMVERVASMGFARQASGKAAAVQGRDTPRVDGKGEDDEERPKTPLLEGGDGGAEGDSAVVTVDVGITGGGGDVEESAAVEAGLEGEAAARSHDATVENRPDDGAAGGDAAAAGGGRGDGGEGGREASDGPIGHMNAELPTHVLRDIEWVVDNISSCTETAETLGEAAVIWRRAMRMHSEREYHAKKGQMETALDMVVSCGREDLRHALRADIDVLVGSRKWQASMVALRGEADNAIERGVAILDRLRPRLKGTMRVLQNSGARKHWDAEMAECISELTEASGMYEECGWEEGVSRAKREREAAEDVFARWKAAQTRLVKEEEGMMADRLGRASREGGGHRTIMTGDADRAMQYGRGESRDFLRARSLFERARSLYEGARDGDGVAQAEQAINDLDDAGKSFQEATRKRCDAAKGIWEMRAQLMIEAARKRGGGGGGAEGGGSRTGSRHGRRRSSRGGTGLVSPGGAKGSTAGLEGAGRRIGTGTYGLNVAPPIEHRENDCAFDGGAFVPRKSFQDESSGLPMDRIDLKAYFDRMWRDGDGQPSTTEGEIAEQRYQNSLSPLRCAPGVRKFGVPHSNLSNPRGEEDDPRGEKRDWRLLPIGPAHRPQLP